jgi:methionine-rich copper-binding protein CopC
MRLLILPMAMALALLMGPSAAAQVALESSTPADGADLPSMPDDIGLRFTGPVQADRARLMLISTGAPAMPLLANGTSDRTLSAPLPTQDTDGDYQVRWQVRSASGAELTGAVSFSVNQSESGFLIEHAVHLVGGLAMVAFAAVALRRARRAP